jgi:anthranilate synthase component 1
MYKPSLEEAKKLKSQGNLLPVYREINADMETPVSAYLKIARGKYSFLLESVEGGERLARYSFLGTEPAMVLTAESPSLYLSHEGREGNGKDPLVLIENEINKYRCVPLEGLPRFHGGMVGYLSYEVARHYEKLPSPVKDSLKLPEANLMLAETLLIFDHLTHKIKVVAHAKLDGDIEKSYKEAKEKIDGLVARLKKPLTEEETNPAAGGDGAKALRLIQNKPTANLTQQEYEEIVTKMKQYIHDGDIYQALPSLRVARPTKAEPFAIYRALRSINPSPYMYFLHLNDVYIVGSSPEMLVRVEDGNISYHPIAGTRARGKDNATDKALENELLNDEKERAEHLMLVDLGRNDVGRISEAGSVKVTQFMDIERYSHVMHLVSHVQGKLRAGLTPYDALRACFPAGTVTGAPKIRAMEIIAELEPEKRGPYSGAVGYFDFRGNLDTAIAIRTIVVKDGTAYLQAGGGIVADSVPANEYQEALNKMQALMSAITQAEGG